MGPDSKALENVKRDAIKATIRHFKNEESDNNFQTDADLDEVENSLLLDNGGYASSKKVKKAKVEEAPADEVKAEKPKGKE